MFDGDHGQGARRARYTHDVDDGGGSKDDDGQDAGTAMDLVDVDCGAILNNRWPVVECA